MYKTILLDSGFSFCADFGFFYLGLKLNPSESCKSTEIYKPLLMKRNIFANEYSISVPINT